MADKEITQLDVLATLAPDDKLLVRDTSSTQDKQADVQLLIDLLPSGPPGQDGIDPVYDHQESVAADTVTTTAIGATDDLPNMSLQTNDLVVDTVGSYFIFFTGEFQHDKANALMGLSFDVGGSPVVNSTLFHAMPFANAPQTISFGCLVQNVAETTIIKVKWGQDQVSAPNTLTCTTRRLSIWGIPQNQVV